MTAASPAPTLAEADRPFTAIAFTLAAMLLFSVMDGIAKHMTASMPPLQVVWGRYFFNTLFLLPWLLLVWRDRPVATGQPKLQLLRGLFMLGSSTFFVTGLAHLPLAQATAIGFVAPLMVTALSMLVSTCISSSTGMAVITVRLGTLVTKAISR